MSKEELSFMENHLITALAVILVSLGGWNLYNTSELKASQNSMYQEIEGQLNLQSAKLDFLKQTFNQRTLLRYTSSDAARDKGQIMSEINMLKLRMDTLKDQSDERRHAEP